MAEISNYYHDFYLFDLAHNFMFIALFFLVIINLMLGHLSAWVSESYDSKRSRQGIVSHGLVLVLLSFVYPIMAQFEINIILQTIMGALSINYLLSIISHYESMGGKVPDSIMKLIEVKRDELGNKLSDSKLERNKDLIVSNAENIKVNKMNIEENRQKIENNKLLISDNRDLILKNSELIAAYQDQVSRSLAINEKNQELLLYLIELVEKEE